MAIPLPNTFLPGTVADANQVNANFSALSVGALALTGGTVGGPLTVTGVTTLAAVNCAALTAAGNIIINWADWAGVTFNNSTDATIYGIGAGSNVLAFNINSAAGLPVTRLGYFDQYGDFVTTGSISTPAAVNCVGLTTTGNIIINYGDWAGVTFNNPTDTVIYGIGTGSNVLGFNINNAAGLPVTALGHIDQSGNLGMVGSIATEQGLSVTGAATLGSLSTPSGDFNGTVVSRTGILYSAYDGTNTIAFGYGAGGLNVWVNGVSVGNIPIALREETP